MTTRRPSTTIDEVWQNLSNDIEHLFRYQTLRYSKWMLLYTDIFNYCTKDTPSNSGDLYAKFKHFLSIFLENFCESVAQLQEADIVDVYVSQWKKYRISSKILHGICSYLHRHYVPRERSNGNDDLQEIYPMAIQTWQRTLPGLLHHQITPCCLSMIRAERQHQNIDRDTIRTLIQTYVTFDTDEYGLAMDSRDQRLDIYQMYFEEQFLRDAQEFYRSEANAYLQQHSVGEYMLQIPRYIDEDVYRVTFYVHPSTVQKLIKALEQVLIWDCLVILYSETEPLMQQGNTQSLNHLYQTVSRVEHGKEELKKIMENYVQQTAIEAIEHMQATTADDLGAYIQTIYTLHQKYLKLCEEAFENDAELINVVDRILRKFVNDNAASRSIGNATWVAECLARYCDRLLRRKNKEEVNVERVFPQIKVLLYYIHEKDVFERFYSKLLAKRLVHQASLSIDHEKLMVLCIQDVYTFACTFKMNQMCRDIETSVDVLDRYRQHCHTEQLASKINFSIMVLHPSAWSFSKAPDIILPNDLMCIINHFTQFYNRLYSGRKLCWLHHHSKCEVQSFFADNVYTLQVSMYQTIVLLLFNTSSTWTVGRIAEETQINHDVLLQVLNVLLDSRILTATECGDRENLDINCTIKLAENLISKKRRINLNIPLRAVEQKEMETIYEETVRDRTMIIQAAIVRIMKQYKAMDENVLVQTVIQELTSYFSADASVIKNCIRALVEKEYLERQSTHADVLHYKA